MWATPGYSDAPLWWVLCWTGSAYPDEPGRIGPFVSDHSGLNGRKGRSMIL
jgi:hypothetical protein